MFLAPMIAMAAKETMNNKAHVARFISHDGTQTMDEDHDRGPQEKVNFADNGEGDPESSSSYEQEQETQPCPLFMSSLPSNFTTNNGLAAIASLLADEVDEDCIHGDCATRKRNKSSIKNKMAVGRTTTAGTTSPSRRTAPRAGGGKCGGASRKGKKSSSASKGQPYPRNETAKGKANVGEAQLFLNMWKL